MRIALAQVDCALGDIDANVERAAKAVAEARGEGADLVIFPELSLCGYSVGEVAEDLAVRADDPRITRLSREAGPMGVLLGFSEGGAGLHTYNSEAYLQDGELVHVHRKLYLRPTACSKSASTSARARRCARSTRLMRARRYSPATTPSSRSWPLSQCRTAHGCC